MCFFFFVFFIESIVELAGVYFNWSMIFLFLFYRSLVIWQSQHSTIMKLKRKNWTCVVMLFHVCCEWRIKIRRRIRNKRTQATKKTRYEAYQLIESKRTSWEWRQRKRTKTGILNVNQMKATKDSGNNRIKIYSRFNALVFQSEILSPHEIIFFPSKLHNFHFTLSFDVRFWCLTWQAQAIQHIGSKFTFLQHWQAHIIKDNRPHLLKFMCPLTV